MYITGQHDADKQNKENKGAGDVKKQKKGESEKRRDHQDEPLHTGKCIYSWCMCVFVKVCVLFKD